ncbi:MAG: carbohydrate ABC transporter permease [Oscillospiraceae bacterium]|nr:carbohydrate ABC transporter permease [Oscillospiraceae bacterium]
MKGKNHAVGSRFSWNRVLITLLILLFTLACLFPFILTFSVSITDENTIMRYGYELIPRKVSFYAYKLIFQKGSSVINGYIISIIVTVVGTLVAVVITGLAGYTLANRKVEYRSGLGLYFFIPMVFNAGIVPWYLICTKMGLRNNILALIIPSLLFNPFNLFLVRNYMEGIPYSLRESATIDGANDAWIALRIYFPLSMPVLATICLFYGLGYWNDWWNAIMLVDNQKLYPVQYLLLQLKSQISMLKDLQSIAGAINVTPPTEAIKMATAIITIGPIVLLYPFLQRYYVSGLVIGSVKE